MELLCVSTPQGIQSGRQLKHMSPFITLLLLLPQITTEGEFTLIYYLTVLEVRSPNVSHWVAIEVLAEKSPSSHCFQL